jgi:hypothetical protein
MNDPNVNKVIEEFSHLPLEDKEYVAEIIRKQLTEVKRQKLAERAREARKNLKKLAVKTGTIKDLMEDLDRD